MFIGNLLQLLALLVLGGVSFFLWFRGKALNHLLMMAGFGVLFVLFFLGWLGIFGYSALNFVLWASSFAWAAAAAGFFLTFWEKIKADVEHFRNLAKQKIAKGGSSPASTTGTPPPPPPPPPPPAG